MVDAEPAAPARKPAHLGVLAREHDLEGVRIDAGRGYKRREGITLLICAPRIDGARHSSQLLDRLVVERRDPRLRRASDSSPLAAPMCGASWT